MTIQEALKTYSDNVLDQDFSYDEKSKTWCISGHDLNNNYFETDDYPADSRAEAESDAVDYLVEYNSNEG